MGLVAAPNYLFGEGTEVRWLGEPTVEMLRDIVLAYTGVPINYPKINLNSMLLQVGLAVGVITVGAFAWQLYTEREDRGKVRGSVLLFALLGSMVVVPFAISTTLIPLLQVRYTIVGLVAVAIILAKTISDINHQPTQLVTLTVVVLLFTAMVPAYYAATPAENWDQSTEIIEDDLSDDSLLVFNPGYTEDAVNYYLNGGSHSNVDSIKFRSDQALSEQIEAGEYEQIWIINIRSENLGEAQDSLPSVYNQERSENLGSIRLFEYEKNGTQETTDGEMGVEK